MSAAAVEVDARPRVGRLGLTASAASSSQSVEPCFEAAPPSFVSSGGATTVEDRVRLAGAGRGAGASVLVLALP